MLKIFLTMLITLIITSCSNSPNSIDDAKDAMKEKYPNIKINSIEQVNDSFFEIIIQDQLYYLTSDFKHLIVGNVIDFKTGKNLTENRLREERIKYLSSIGDKNSIVYKPEKTRHTIVIFTDTSCPYCQKLHNEVNDLLLNDNELTGDEDILSNASCTTNCLAPVCKILTENFTVVKGSMSTIHGYTADQNIQDAPHSDLRRARAAAINIVPTTTGAAIATAIVVPAIKDKLTSMAFRVPIPTGSVIELNVLIEETTDVDRLKALFKKRADTDMKGILEYSTDPLVSCDIVGNKHSSILDSQLINVMDGNLLKIISWYDNEAGYSARLAQLVAK